MLDLDSTKNISVALVNFLAAASAGVAAIAFAVTVRRYIKLKSSIKEISVPDLPADEKLSILVPNSIINCPVKPETLSTAPSKPKGKDAVREKVLKALSKDRTADEVASLLSLSVLSVRPRITELRNAGLIEKTGQRRKNASGSKTYVWHKV